MGNIQVLSFDLANLIAAGEVVDRPASVLKELLENAIDAGATRITAEIKRGGSALIRVSDNGCGMSAEDLPVAIRRHATSKIHRAEDLNAIATLGFRGEALAAIAAVAELRIMTKQRDAEVGTLLVAEQGTVTDLSEVGTADGTTVVVENLFANVPARRKFLKKDATETMASAAVVEKLAMSRPEIAFELITDGTTRFKTAGDGQLHHVLYAILGRDFAGRLLAVEGSVHGVAVSGFVGTSDNVRNNRNHQNVFINGRYIKSKTVMAALEKAYTSYIAPERFPVCALFLTVNASTVDVNVHPAKLEVKFSDERVIFESVYYAVRSALEQNETRPELALDGKRQRKNPLSAFVPVGDKSRAAQYSAAAALFADAARPAGVTGMGQAADRGETRREGAAPPAPSVPHTAAMPPEQEARPQSEAAMPNRVEARQQDGAPASVGEKPASSPRQEFSVSAMLSDLQEQHRGGDEGGAFSAVPLPVSRSAVMAAPAELPDAASETEPLTVACEDLFPPSARAPFVRLSEAEEEKASHLYISTEEPTEERPKANEPSPVQPRPAQAPASARAEADLPAASAAGAETPPLADAAAQPDGPFTTDTDYRIVGEAFRCYVLVEQGDSLLLIDKHAAHERILFEDLLAKQRENGRVGTQYLLVPLRVPLAEEELAAAAEYRGELEAVGFDFTVEGEARAAILSAVPDAVAATDAEELFARMTAELAEGAGNPAMTEQKRRERTLYQVACKAAIKGGRQYGEAQIAWLVGRVMALPDITVCPHGRPIAIRLTKNSLDKQFNRIM